MRRASPLSLICLLGAALTAGCGPKADDIQPVTVTPTDASGVVSGGDQTAGGDFGKGAAATVAPGKEDVPTPGSEINTPGNEMPADAK